MAVVVAVVIVLAMNLIGTLLISALIVFPALSAMRIFKNFRSTVIFRYTVGFCAAAIIISLAAETPVGSTIVAVNIAAFGICSAVGLAVRR